MNSEGIDPGCRIPDTSNQKSDARSQKPDAGCSIPENHETLNVEPGTYFKEKSVADDYFIC
jgi:hypothetical protein